jgi:uncharacterized protein YecT (DUF1311 family)
MRQVVIFVWLLFGCWFALPAAAHAQNQHEMNRQADADFKKADTELNRVYKKLMATLPADRRKLLVTSQLAWIKFRDAEAKFAASENEGGSIYPLVYSGTLARLTKTRTAELKQMMSQDR